MPAFTATAPGKMILAGEHAVVYGQPAIAFPLPEIRARVIIEPKIKQPPGTILFEAQDIGITGPFDSLTPDHAFNRILQIFQAHFHISQIPACLIRISSTIPIASGMGSGAAVAAAMFRTLAGFIGKGISDQEVSDLTFEIEKTFHGNPSGIDNSVVAFQRPIFYMKNHPLETLHLKRSFTFLLADTGIRSSTRIAVEGVRQRWEKSKEKYNGYFAKIGSIVPQIREGLAIGDECSVGDLMNQNHELLRKIGVSNEALDTLVNTAIKENAYGAKLIGAGLGGSIAALVAPESAETIAESLKEAGAVWNPHLNFSAEGRMNNHLIFLKLGGSLITDKTKPHTAHRELISHLGQEILVAIKQDPDIQLILGHGSGSFGHIPAKKYGTRKGVSTSEDWVGFWEVWKEAQALDQIVLDEFQKVGLKVMTFPPSSMVITLDHKVIHWDTRPIQTAFENGIIPLVYGDVVFDPALGGTILSTEELFSHLTGEFKPARILLVGREKGIYKDFPKTQTLIPMINHENIQAVESSVHMASAIDVTGGMLSKMKLMWTLCENDADLSIDFCSADEKNPLHEIILGSQSGTRMQY